MSDKTVCQYCGSKITPEIEVCPHCNVNLKTGKPVVHIGGLVVLIVAGLVPLLLGILLIRFHKPNSKDHSEIIAFAMALFVLIPTIKGIIENIRLNRTAKLDPDRFRNLMKQRRLAKEAKREKEEKRLEHIPACPICGSNLKVNRLTELDRSASTAVFGVASARIGKQWECTACNYSFNVDASSVPYPATKVDSTTTTDPVDELRKYKQLLDDGVITQEDYDQKKKQLLRL